MAKKIIILVVSLFSLVSCKEYNYLNRFEGITPYIEVEKTSIKDYYIISVNDYITKFESKESFVCFFYSSSCPYCIKLINNIIKPYINDTGNKIYGVDVYDDNNYKELSKIEKYQPLGNDYFSAENSTISISRPVVQIIEYGIIIDYVKGYSIKVEEMLYCYIINWLIFYCHIYN